MEWDSVCEAASPVKVVVPLLVITVPPIAHRVSLEYLPPAKLSLTVVQPFMFFAFSREDWSNA